MPVANPNNIAVLMEYVRLHGANSHVHSQGEGVDVYEGERASGVKRVLRRSERLFTTRTTLGDAGGDCLGPSLQFARSVWKRDVQAENCHFSASRIGLR